MTFSMIGVFFIVPCVKIFPHHYLSSFFQHLSSEVLLTCTRIANATYASPFSPLKCLAVYIFFYSFYFPFENNIFLILMYTLDLCLSVMVLLFFVYAALKVACHICKSCYKMISRFSFQLFIFVQLSLIFSCLKK